MRSKLIAATWIVLVIGVAAVAYYRQARLTPGNSDRGAGYLENQDAPGGTAAAELRRGLAKTPHESPNSWIAEETELETVPLESRISEAMNGQQTDFVAHVISVYRHPAGHVFLTVRIDNTNQQIDVPVFASLNHEGSGLVAGARIWVQGIVGTYKGKLQVVPDNATQVKILVATDPERVRLVQVDDIVPGMRGQMVQVRGSILALRERGGHVFFQFGDANGKRIQGVLFRADTEEMPVRKVRILQSARTQTPIRVLATIDVYNDKLELIVDKVFDTY